MNLKKSPFFIAEISANHCGSINKAMKLIKCAKENGADAVLVNTAIAGAQDPEQMAEAFKLGVIAGRKAYLSGRIPITNHANPSSPKDNISKS